MYTFNIPKKNFNPQSYTRFLKPLQKIFPNTPQLKSWGYRPLKMIFEDQLHALIFSISRNMNQLETLFNALKRTILPKNI